MWADPPRRGTTHQLGGSMMSHCGSRAGATLRPVRTRRDSGAVNQKADLHVSQNRMVCTSVAVGDMCFWKIRRDSGAVDQKGDLHVSQNRMMCTSVAVGNMCFRKSCSYRRPET